MTGTADPNWDRHAILAQIKRRFGSLKAFADTTPLAMGHYSVALERPYPKAEKLISKALGVPLQELWPDRYDARGRRHHPGRPGNNPANPKPGADRRAAP